MGKYVPISDAEYKKVIDAFLELKDNGAPALSKRTGIAVNRINTIINKYFNQIKKVTD